MEKLSLRVIAGVKAIYRANLAAGNSERFVEFEGKEYEVAGEKRLQVLPFVPKGSRESGGSQTQKIVQEDEKTAQPTRESRRPLFVQDDPWSEPVETHAILGEVMAKIREYVVMDYKAYVATTLYVLVTYVVEALPICPLLIISSAVKRSGKTRLLGVLSRLCHFALATNNISPAALYRTIEEYKPTLMVDEVDTIFTRRSDTAEALRGILNAGHDRSSSNIIRCETETHEPLLFDAFGPKVLFGIGNIPETIEDRGIVIKMRRKTEKETIRRFSALLDMEDFAILRQKLTRWARDFGINIATTLPNLLPGLDDRAMDNWIPLLSIASLAGKEWTDAAGAVAIGLSSKRNADGDLKITLLRNIQSIFEEDGYPPERTTERLLQKLNSLEESPWKTYHYQRGEPLDARGLAKLLRPFEIHSFGLRQGLQVLRAYKLADFQEAWDRYLTKEDDLADASDSPPQNQTPPAG